MNGYLINEYPLQVLPSLCKKVGINEAIFIQELHYWLLESEQERNGKKWVCKTYKELQETLKIFPLNTLKRIVKSLSDKQLLIIDNFNEMKMDKTNWYSINYVKLGQLYEC